MYLIYYFKIWCRQSQLWHGNKRRTKKKTAPSKTELISLLMIERKHSFIIIYIHLFDMSRSSRFVERWYASWCLWKHDFPLNKSDVCMFIILCSLLMTSIIIWFPILSFIDIIAIKMPTNHTVPLSFCFAFYTRIELRNTVGIVDESIY